MIQLRYRPRGFTLIELLVVIGILTAILGLTVLIGPVLSVADRMQRRAALLELGVELEQVCEDVQDAASEAREAIIWIVVSRRIDREQIAELMRTLEALDDQLAELLSRMETTKPQLTTEVDRQLVCAAIVALGKLSSATQGLKLALKALLLPNGD